MQALATRRQPIIHVLVAIAIFACGKAKPVAQRDAAVVVAVDAAAPPVDAGGGGISIRITKKPPPGSALAKRCVLGGDPMTSDCVGGGQGMAVGRDALYVVAGRKVRRFKRAAGAECRFDETGAPIEMPPDNPRPQELGKGPIYMRSGGAAWRVVRFGDAIYAFDFLGGMFRIDRGKPEPACDVFGYNTAAQLGKKLLVQRNGIEELKLGKRCKAVSANIADKVRGELYVVRDQVYVASGSDITRYDGATPVKLGEGTRVCYVKSMTACGDGVCAIDTNCKQVIQLGADGKVLRTLEDDRVFETMPWSLHDAVTFDNGNVYVLARHRDTADGKDICEAAIYELPAAAFAL